MKEIEKKSRNNYSVKRKINELITEKKNKLNKIYDNLTDLIENSDSKFITIINSDGMTDINISHNNKEISFNVSFAGYYNINNSIWYWVWAIEGMNKKLRNNIQNSCINIKSEIDKNYKYSENFSESDNYIFYYDSPIFNCKEKSVNKFLSGLLLDNNGLYVMKLSDDVNITYYIINEINYIK